MYSCVIYLLIGKVLQFMGFDAIYKLFFFLLSNAKILQDVSIFQLGPQYSQNHIVAFKLKKKTT